MTQGKVRTIEPEVFQKTFQSIQEALGRVIVGQGEVVQRLLVAFFAGGHVLLEGVPGLGKTLLAKSFAQAMGLMYKRIQCTPDMMPADILGTQLVVERAGTKVFEFSKGPVFTHILLADEINRTTPKTQSALLEAMEERQVSVAGKTFTLDEPFFVIATQNPIEMEGTFNLPEAQLDRFLFRIFVDYPTTQELSQIIRQTTTAVRPTLDPVLQEDKAREWILSARQLVREVLVSSEVEDYIVRLVTATRPHGGGETREGQAAGAMDGAASRWLRYGASPRGAQAMLLGAKVLALINGRVNVSLDDVERVMIPALNHRIVLSFEAEAERRTSTDVLRELTQPIRSSA